MDITRFSIRNNRVTIGLVLVILTAGFAAFRTMPQAEDPGFVIRAAQIQTYFPGANPDRVEALVTDKLEKAIQTMPELDFVKSESRSGISIITAMIKDEYTEMRPIWDSLRRKIDSAAGDLPDGIVGPFVNDEFGEVFGTLVALTAEGYSYAEMRDYAYSVRDDLLRLDDTAKVDIYGLQDERVFVEFNNARLAELGISVLQLKQILEARNIIIPGGSVLIGIERIELEPSGNFDSVDELRRTVINIPGQSDFLYLEDIADVTRGYIDPPQSLVRSSGKPALVLAISMKETGNIVTLGEQVGETVERLTGQLPIGLDLEIVAYQSAVVEKKVKDFTGSVLQAIAIVLLVMLVMLGVRTGLVVATLVPSAMLMTLMFLQPMGESLNQMSLAALIIALGMLVDNAIVMSESIMVRMAEGAERVEAAVESAGELRIPLLVSSLTTAAAFLPIYLAEGTLGEYTGVLFTVVTITLLSSWVLSLTLIPLLCTLFLKVEVKQKGKKFDSRFYRFYRGLLLGVLRFRLVSMGVMVIVFVLALQGFRFVPNIFFPPSDTPMFTALIETPLGTSIERSQEISAEIDTFVEYALKAGSGRDEGVTSWTSYIGRGAPRFTLTYNPSPPSSAISFFLFNTTSDAITLEMMEKLDGFCRERLPEVVPTVRKLQLGATVGNPIEVRVSGEDQEALFRLVDQVKSKLRSIPGNKDIGDDWGQRTKKIFVAINEARALRAGITHQDIAISLQSNLSGYEATEYREGDEVIPVTLRSAAADRQHVGKLESLNVYSQQTGRSVPLKQVADLHLEWQPAKILRRNRLKTVTVTSQLEGRTAKDVTDELIPWLDEQQTSSPFGYFYALGGEYEQSGKGNAAVVANLPVAGLIITLLLLGQFNSVRRTLIILLTIPLGLVGVVLGLLIARSHFGFMTLLGVISLAGIVINNAIVLLDRIRIEIEETGLEPPRAVIESTQRRLRPILLTTMTTIGGLIPLWLGGGPMWESMAIAIIFGLLFATVLTLGVVPVLYSLFFRVSFKSFRY